MEIILAALPSILSALVVFIATLIYNKLKSEATQRKNGHDELLAMMKEMRDELDNVKGITGDMLRDRLQHVLKTYIERGCCPMADRDTLQHLFDDYKKKLKGNGHIERMFKRVCALPYEKPKD